MKLNKIFNLLFITILSIWLSGCGIYSFTGANVSPDIKTISVKNFINTAGQGPATLSQTFTESLRDFFLKNTNLTLVKDNGDLQMEGVITSYGITPLAAQNQNVQGTNQTTTTAAKTRLTIKVKAKFTNTKDKTQDFDQEFSFYSDYDQSQTLTNVENDGTTLSTIESQIILDIFNKSLANW